MTFFRYPGGKSKLRKQIVERLIQCSSDDCTEYRELFFGGGSITLQFLKESHQIQHVTINDRDPGIACLWESVISHYEQFQDYIMRFKPSVKAFIDFRDILLRATSKPKKETHRIKLGFCKLAIHQISFSGLGTKSGGPLGGVKQESEYKIDCRWNPQRICKQIDAIRSLLRRFEVYQNTCTSEDFMLGIQRPGVNGSTLLFLDPPYWNKGSDLYQFSFTEQDHIRLAKALRETDHRFVLMYDSCEAIEDLYSWAKIETISEVNYSINTARKKPELLITRGSE